MPTWSPATITQRTEPNEALFTFTLDRSMPFIPGQFVSLTRDPGGSRHTRRAYSILSPPGVPLRFLFVEVQGGAVSPGLRDAVPGDTMYVADRAKGRFTPDRVPTGTRVLWMLATGTGIAPYHSMILDGGIFSRVDRVIIAYGVRHPDRLLFAEELATHPRVSVIPTVSRTPRPTDLPGRVGQRLADGTLESAAGTSIEAGDHVMLCGNPDMIRDVGEVLDARGIPQADRTTERYW